MNPLSKILLGSALLGKSLTGMAQTEKPNILFILTDDENISSLSCYGGKVHTPNIDQIANNGVRFTNANVVHSVCSPSRYSILTGRYYANNTDSHFLNEFPKGEASCVGNSISLEQDGNNIASILQENGYHTGFVGKFHLTRHELLVNTKKWEENGLQTYAKDSDPALDAQTNQKMKSNHEWWRKEIGQFGFDYVNGVYAANLRENYNKYLNAHNVEWTADAALDFIQSQEKEKEPFFLYFSTTYPHGPAPERKINGKYVCSLDADPAYTGEGYLQEDFSDRVAERQQIKDSEDAQLSKIASTALWWDHTVGKIIQKLKETGQYENTIIVYTSDHGKTNHGKTTLYETGVHVPLLIQWPANMKKSMVYDHVVGSVDYTPTLLEVAGAQLPKSMKMDGVSFASVLKGSQKATRKALLLQMGYATAVKTDDWKYIAVRYPMNIEKDIEAGKQFRGFRKEKVAQPYYMLHRQLCKKAEHACEHYWERNQLYDYKKDSAEKNNVFFEQKTIGKEMKKLLAKELKKNIPDRPYGEFIGKQKDDFEYLGEKLNHPEKQK